MKKIIVVLVFLAAIAALVWWLKKPAAPAEAEADKAVAQVQVARLELGPISRTLPVFGLIEAAAEGVRTLTVGYDCRVQQVVAAAGARVEAGAMLMTIEPSADALLQTESARGAEKLAARALASARQRYELKLGTGDDLRAAEQAEAEAKLKLASYERRGMGGPAQVRASAAGIVTKLDVQGGAFVPAGTPLAVLSAGGKLEARLSAEASDAAALKPDEKVALTAVDRPDAGAVEAMVGSVGGSVDPVTGTIDVRVPLADGSAWFVGEHVRGEIELERKTALVAPRAAVLPDEDDQVIYTVVNHKAVRHTVEVGIAAGDKVEIIAKDMHAGDVVVVQGNYELEDGMGVLLPGEGGKGGTETKP